MIIDHHSIEKAKKILFTYDPFDSYEANLTELIFDLLNLCSWENVDFSKCLRRARAKLNITDNLTKKGEKP